MKKTVCFYTLFLVQQIFANDIFYWKINTKEKIIFLTFDDGPGVYTSKVLEILDKYKIKATFFVLGEMVKIYPDKLKDIFNKGHTIASHTYSHVNFYSLQKTRNLLECKNILIEELQKTEKEIRNVLGDYKVTLCRIPYGYYRRWMDEIFKNYNYKVINWTFGCDWENISEKEMVEGYINALQEGGIYLFHDGGKNRDKTINVLEKFIQVAISKGYKFADIGTYLNLKNKNF